MTEEESNILRLILKKPKADDRYIVVQPETGFSAIDDIDRAAMPNQDPADLIRQSKVYIATKLHIGGRAVINLVERLFERNMQRERLTLESSPADGYVIDYDDKFSGYFNIDGGGWRKLYDENPKAAGRMQISIPVYDPGSALVMIYRGLSLEWLYGSGCVILYKYENGMVEEIKNVRLWVS